MIDKLSEQLAAEKARIVQARLLSWSSAGESEPFCGLDVRPLTARAWVDLQLAENAFFVDGMPEMLDVLNYLWRNSTEYAANAPVRRKRALQRRLRRSTLDELVGFVLEHIMAAFAEAPEEPEQGSSFSRSNRMPAFEGVIGAVDELAHRYGQDPHCVIDWPLHRIFQLQKAIRTATIPDYKLNEPQSVRLLKGKILTEIQNGKS